MTSETLSGFNVNSAVKRIHVVHKTHLDIGFTDYPANVIARYINDFIPGAIALADSLVGPEGEPQFIWSTGSWLIQQALKTGTAEQIANVERAITENKISWHAMPFSVESELLDPELVKAGIEISKQLDIRFGRQTIAAKMTDVPGHTIGLVPIFASLGIHFLHIGANPASATPQVPSAFRWIAPDGSEIVVGYDSDYGASDGLESLTVIGDQALYISFTNDNLGPPTLEDVANLMEKLRSLHPEAEVLASTFNDFATQSYDARSTLPVITNEIGDSWVHGVASDPTLMAQYRRLLSVRDGWLADGTANSEELQEMSENLLLIAEHTWGGNLQVFLPDYIHYQKAEFNTARANDLINLADTPEDLKFATTIARTHPRYSEYEQTWKDKRSYLGKAIASLPERLRFIAEKAIDGPGNVQRSGSNVNPGVEIQLGEYRIILAEDGSLCSLRSADGRQWADDVHRIGRYSYQEIAEIDYQKWFDGYVRNFDRYSWWVVPDFGKPGIDRTSPLTQSRTFSPTVADAILCNESEADILRVKVNMPVESVERLGAPRTIEIEYIADSDGGRIDIRLRLAGKDALRLPEASWFSFQPLMNSPEMWRIRKLGTLVDPMSTVFDGSRTLHAVESIEHVESDFSITSVEAPVVALGRRNILDFDNKLPELSDGFHFLLHNNVWGTNYRMWFDEDITYQFFVRTGSAH